jgi:hypothetical protein
MTMTTANTLRKIGTSLGNLIPAGFSFSLIIFPKDRPGLGCYISTADRNHSVHALRTAAVRLQRNETTKPIESN